MIPSLGQSVASSIKEYFNYRLFTDLDAYSNKSVVFYPYSDKKWTNKAVYGSPFAQWAYHQEVPGVAVPAGVSGAGGFITRGTNGLILDFRNGRVLLDSNQTGLSLSGTVAVADVNTYVTTSSDSQIVGETNFLTLPRKQAATGYLAPYSEILPALFFRITETENLPLALGGKDWTAYKIRVVAVMNTTAQLTAVGDMLRDSKNRVFPILTGTPLNEYNDLRSAWDYSAYLNTPESYGFIERATFGYLQNDTFQKNNPKLEVGIGTLDIRLPRFPHNSPAIL